MFNKTLIAAALTLASLNVAAVQMGATNQTISVEGVAAGNLGATKEIDAKVVIATLGAEYTVGDTITFTAVGGTFSDSTYALASTGATGGGDPEVVTWGLLNSTDSVLTFRATSITAAGTGFTAARVYSLEGATAAELDMKVTSIAKGATVSIVSSAQTSNGIAIDVVDVASTAANEDAAYVGNGVQQFVTKVNAGAVKVDVGNERKTFVVAANANFDVEYAEAGATIADVGLTDTVITVTGDYTGVKSLTECGVDAICGGANAADDVDIVIATAKDTATAALGNVAARDLKFEYTLESGSDAVTLTAPQNFTVDLVAKYEVNSTLVSGSTASAWTLNGSSDQVAFLPFGSEYAQSITVTNTGTVTGEITVDFTAEGVTTSRLLAASATAKSVTNISLEVATIAAELGLTGNVGIKVVVNAPDTTTENQIQVKAVYYHKASADRVLTH